MSTKIYHGYRVVGNPTPYELRCRFARLRSDVWKVLNKEHLALVRALCGSLLDQIAHGEPPEGYYNKQPLIHYVLDDIERIHKEIQRTKLRDPLFDFSFELEVIPIKGKVLLMAFADRGSFFRLLGRQKWARYYGYWDNTDPDEKCSVREWKQRGKDWDEALPGVGVPSENGFSVDLGMAFLPRHSKAAIMRKMSKEITWAMLSQPLKKRPKKEAKHV
jgi:hypothetical protein